MDTSIDFIGRAGIVMLIAILQAPENYGVIFKIIAFVCVMLFIITPFTKKQEEIKNENSN